MAMRRMKRAAKKSGKKAAKKSVMRRRRKAKRVSRVGRKWQVFKGTKVKTQGGLKKTELFKNKRGRVVSKKQSHLGKALFNKYGRKWMSAVKEARKSLGIKGFQAIGGKTTKGQVLLKRARSFYKK